MLLESTGVSATLPWRAASLMDLSASDDRRCMGMFCHLVYDGTSSVNYHQSATFLRCWVFARDCLPLFRSAWSSDWSPRRLQFRICIRLSDRPRPHNSYFTAVIDGPIWLTSQVGLTQTLLQIPAALLVFAYTWWQRKPFDSDSNILFDLLDN